MAQVFGKSQAWKSVLVQLGPDASLVDGPEALSRLVESLDKSRPLWRAEAEASLRQQIRQRAERLVQLESQIRQQQQQAQTQIGPQIRSLQATLDEYRHQGNWLVRLYHRLTVIPHLQKKLARARQALAAATVPLQVEWQKCQQDKQFLENRFPQHVAETLCWQERRLAGLRRVLASPELAGATAELEVAGQLGKLPESFVVLHDVQLALCRYIQFNGSHLKTAQCDHVVVGPTGIFVIESKRWSRSFASQAEHFDPFEQVGRARFVCQCLLRESGLQVTPHDIIANAGTPLAKPPGARARICRPEALLRILTDRPTELSPEQVRHIVANLARYLPHA